MRKGRFTPEERMRIAKEYLSGAGGYRSMAAQYGINPEVIREWVIKYKKNGESAFQSTSGNRHYSKELKEAAVKAYLSGKGSEPEIVAKYNISSTSVLRAWIKRYNTGQELRDYKPRREVYMKEATRKTTLAERKEIVEYCLAHGKDYKETAALYSVSYSQVYDWVKKYLEDGEVGLIDRRGHHKSDDEVDEMERLRRENQRLKRQLEEKDMVVELLKKVKEFEKR